MKFQSGRYYCRNGFKAIIKYVEGWEMYGMILIPDNIWVPTYWNASGNSAMIEFDLVQCIENHEDEIIKWDSSMK